MNESKMYQEIITYLIVGSAITYALYSFYKTFTVRNEGTCGGCAQCDLKKELKKKGKLYLHGKDHKKLIYRSLQYIPQKQI